MSFYFTVEHLLKNICVEETEMRKFKETFFLYRVTPAIIITNYIDMI